jgi:hypothetical protein
MWDIFYPANCPTRPVHQFCKASLQSRHSANGAQPLVGQSLEGPHEVWHSAAAGQSGARARTPNHSRCGTVQLLAQSGARARILNHSKSIAVRSIPMPARCGSFHRAVVWIQSCLDVLEHRTTSSTPGHAGDKKRSLSCSPFSVLTSCQSSLGWCRAAAGRQIRYNRRYERLCCEQNTHGYAVLNSLSAENSDASRV